MAKERKQATRRVYDNPIKKGDKIKCIATELICDEPAYKYDKDSKIVIGKEYIAGCDQRDFRTPRKELQHIQVIVPVGKSEVQRASNFVKVS